MGWRIWSLNLGREKTSPNKEWLWGPASLLFDGQWCSLPGIKRLWHEVDHSPPTSAEVKKARSCTSTPPTWLHSVGRDNLFFQYMYQISVYLPPVFPTKGRMNETVGEQLSSLVNVSPRLHGVAQDLMYYSHITSFGFIVAWTQEWDMK